MATLTQLVTEAVKGNSYEDVELVPGNVKTKVRIKKYLTLEEHAKIVRDIAETVFLTVDSDDIDTDEEYDPAYTYFARYYQLINYFVDIKNYNDVEKINQLIYRTNIIGEIMRVVGSEYVFNIFEEADILIREKTKRNSNKLSHFIKEISPVLNELSAVFSDFDEDKISRILSSLKTEE